MTVTVELVLTEVAPFIPEFNVLSDEHLEALAASLIAKHGSDDSKLGIIKCEFLKLLGYQNSVIESINPTGVKSEKLGDHAVTYGGDAGLKPDWSEYIKNVNNVLCPMFGVCIPFNLGTRVDRVPRKRIISDCSRSDGLIL